MRRAEDPGEIVLRNFTGQAEGRRQKAEGPGEIVLTQFHGASRRQKKNIMLF